MGEGCVPACDCGVSITHVVCLPLTGLIGNWMYRKQIHSQPKLCCKYEFYSLLLKFLQKDCVCVKISDMRLQKHTHTHTLFSLLKCERPAS